MPDPYLDADAIHAATFARHVEIHETLGSTNDRAAELARDAAINLPAPIVARHQTAGRGRGDNKWLSTEGASHSVCCSNQHCSESAPPTGPNFRSQPPSLSATRLQSN